MNEFESKDEWCYDYSKHKIFELYNLPPIGIDFYHNNIQFCIKKFKLLDIENYTFEFELYFKCKKCKEDNTFLQKIIFSDTDYIPKYFDYPCIKCKSNFHSDSFFTNFWMEDD